MKTEIQPRLLSLMSLEILLDDGDSKERQFGVQSLAGRLHSQLVKLTGLNPEVSGRSMMARDFRRGKLPIPDTEDWKERHGTLGNCFLKTGNPGLECEVKPHAGWLRTADVMNLSVR